MDRRRARRRTHFSPRGRALHRFTYKQQFGVIVMCRNEVHQRTIYNRLSRQGLACKVVVV